MAKLANYLIPCVTNGRKGKHMLAMEYVLYRNHRVDRRTCFERDNKQYKINSNDLELLLDKYNMKVKDHRVIAPDGKTARAFYFAVASRMYE